MLILLFFCSNTASKDIFKYALTTKRENIELQELNRIIRKANMRMRLKYDTTHIPYNLLTANVPFLPLEKEHVEECIEDFLELKHPYLILNNRIRQITKDLVLKELNFVPDDNKKFSLTGCKRISEKVDYALLDD